MTEGPATAESGVPPARVARSGVGPALLCVPGLAMVAASWWRVLPLLESRFTVLRYDGRGAGGGAGALPAPPYSLEQMADDAAAVLDAAGVGSAYVFGVSMGGLVAQELALRNRERVRGLVLGATHVGGREAARMDPAAWAVLRGGDPAALAPWTHQPGMAQAVLAHDLAVKRAHAPQPAGFRAQLEAMLAHRGTWGRLGELAGVPVTVLHGSADRLVDPANGRILAAALPGARLVELAGAAHEFWTDRPEQTYAELVAATLG